jgi:hypothetical protein
MSRFTSIQLRLGPGHRDLVRLRDNLGQEIGLVDEALAGVVFGVDHADVGLRLVTAAFELESWPLCREQRPSVPCQTPLEQPLEAAGDLVMRNGWRGIIMATPPTSSQRS